MRYPVFLAIFIFYYHAVLAAHNVTIDDPDSLIAYAGSWSRVSSSLAAGGSHAYSQDLTATATFTFTGVAIYYMASRWPYPVNTLVTLDSGTPSLIDLTDHGHSAPSGTGETVQSAVVWGQNGLPNTQHTFRASMATGGSFIVMDTLIYTVLDASDISSAPSSTKSPSSQHSTVSSPSSSATTTPKRGSSRTPTAVVVGIVGGLLVVAIVAVASFFICRRRRRSPSTADVYFSPSMGGSAQTHNSISPFLDPGVPSTLATAQYAQSNTSLPQTPIFPYSSSIGGSPGPSDSYGYASHQHLGAPLAQSDMASPPIAPAHLPYGYQPTDERAEASPAQSETAFLPGGSSNLAVSSGYQPIDHQKQPYLTTSSTTMTSSPGGFVTPSVSYDYQIAGQQNDAPLAPSGMAPPASSVSNREFDPYASIGNALIEPPLSSSSPQNARPASSTTYGYPNIPSTPGSGKPFLDNGGNQFSSYQLRESQDYAPPAYSPI